MQPVWAFGTNSGTFVPLWARWEEQPEISMESASCGKQKSYKTPRKLWESKSLKPNPHLIPECHIQEEFLGRLQGWAPQTSLTVFNNHFQEKILPDVQPGPSLAPPLILSLVWEKIPHLHSGGKLSPAWSHQLFHSGSRYLCYLCQLKRLSSPFYLIYFPVEFSLKLQFPSLISLLAVLYETCLRWISSCLEEENRVPLSFLQQNALFPSYPLLFFRISASCASSCVTGSICPGLELWVGCREQVLPSPGPAGSEIQPCPSGCCLLRAQKEVKDLRFGSWRGSEVDVWLCVENGLFRALNRAFFYYFYFAFRGFCFEFFTSCRGIFGFYIILLCFLFSMCNCTFCFKNCKGKSHLVLIEVFLFSVWEHAEFHTSMLHFIPCNSFITFHGFSLRLYQKEKERSERKISDFFFFRIKAGGAWPSQAQGTDAGKSCR